MVLKPCKWWDKLPTPTSTGGIYRISGCHQDGKKRQNEFSGPRLLWVCAMWLFCGNGYILIGGWGISFVATNSTLRFLPQIPVGGWFCWCLWLCLEFHRFSYPKWYQPYPFKNPRFRDPDPQLKWRGTWDPAIGLLDSRLGFHPQDMLGKLWDFFGGNLRHLSTNLQSVKNLYSSTLDLYSTPDTGGFII